MKYSEKGIHTRILFYKKYISKICISFKCIRIASINICKNIEDRYICVNEQEVM